MSARKSIAVVDWAGNLITAFEDGEAHGKPSLALNVVRSDANGNHASAAGLSLEDAKAIGEWLVAWAKEHGA